MKVINRSKLLEGLKKLKQNLSASPIVVIEDVESLVKSLEVKEIDLDKEIETFSMELSMKENNGDWLKDITTTAKHFFELGLKVTNSLTWQDIFIIRRFIYEYDKEIKMKSDIKYPLHEEFCTEVLKRFRAQKGERV